jgi:hypothetical protein
MNPNLILFIVLTILFVFSLLWEYDDLKENGKYENRIKLKDNFTNNDIKLSIENGFWNLENAVIWRRTIIATYIFFVITYLAIWSIQTSYGGGYTNNVSTFPWIIVVLIAFIIFYLMQSYFKCHHTSMVVNQLRKHIKNLK